MKSDYATALKHFRPLAKQGHADAQWELGLMYKNGLGVTKDPKEALHCGGARPPSKAIPVRSGAPTLNRGPVRASSIRNWKGCAEKTSD
jgi:hypothetical protein